eukprot:scaffold145754_cov68-Attheya_sp.AAC.2
MKRAAGEGAVGDEEEGPMTVSPLFANANHSLTTNRNYQSIIATANRSFPSDDFNTDDNNMFVERNESRSPSAWWHAAIRSRKKMVIASIVVLTTWAALDWCMNRSYNLNDYYYYNAPLLGNSRSYRNAQKVARKHLKYLNAPNPPFVAESSPSSSKRTKKPIMIQETLQPGCEGTIILLRHCEKESLREHCTYVGYERAVYLSTLFGSGEERWPIPSHLYALNAGARHNKHKKNMREIETLEPLSVKANVTIDDSYKEQHMPHLARQIVSLFREGHMCGKIIVVAWKHSEIPRFARHLGCGPTEGCPLDYQSTEFDNAWQIKLVYQTPWHSSKKHVQEKNLWRAYGSVQQEGFDPLAMSKKSGDYPLGGTAIGGRWIELDPPEKKEHAAFVKQLNESHHHHHMHNHGNMN